MSEEPIIKTVCSKCGMVYELDRSLIGQWGECAECGSAFEIQDYTEYVNQTLAAQAAQAAAASEQVVAPQAAPAPQSPAPAPAAPQPPAPAPATPPPDASPVADDGTVKMKSASDDSGAPTNTVKLSRMKTTGMLPQMPSDGFKVGTINASTQTVIGSSRSHKKFTSSRGFSTGGASTARKPKHWWDFLLFWK